MSDNPNMPPPRMPPQAPDWLRGPNGFRDRCVLIMLEAQAKNGLPSIDNMVKFAKLTWIAAEALTQERQRLDASVQG